MTVFFLEKIRKIIKSIAKIEFKIVDKIILNFHNKIKNNYKVKLYDRHFKKLKLELELNKNLPKKMIIVICFYFNLKKLKILSQTLHNLSLLNFKKEIFILTNELSNNQRNSLKRLFKKNKIYCSIKEIRDLPENNLLPWYSLNLMREKIKNKNNSHFMYMEDDILINTVNIKYWIYFRRILKVNNLIPSFIRYENFRKRKISVDNPKKIFLNKLPKIETESKKNGFVNSKFPYHAMYIMDRELMTKYLQSNAVNLDFSFSNKFMKSIYPIKELANISHAYLDILKGFHNNFVIPFCDKDKIPNYCLIKHNEKKYTNFKKLNKIGYGTIDIDELIN